jgi:hypothetical protein
MCLYVIKPGLFFPLVMSSYVSHKAVNKYIAVVY